MSIDQAFELRIMDSVIGSLAKDVSDEALTYTGRVLQRDIFDILSIPWPPASKEEEAPHYRSSTLRRSVISYKVGDDQFVGPTAPYALDLIVRLKRRYLTTVVANRVKDPIQIKATQRL